MDNFALEIPQQCESALFSLEIKWHLITLNVSPKLFLEFTSFSKKITNLYFNIVFGKVRILVGFLGSFRMLFGNIFQFLIFFNENFKFRNYFFEDFQFSAF